MVTDAVLPSPTISQESGGLPQERASGLAESVATAAALALLAAARVVYAFVYRVDSDEPQHLHVVWGWAHGLLQYKQVFDNHSPLFQMLCAPLFRLIGEHAWIVIPMRLAMLPLYAADLWLVYLIGRSLYTQRWGIWAALTAGAVPIFFLVTTEFRTDDLWTTLWLGTVWLAVTGPLVGRKAFIFGLTMGACFAVSMKTTLLLLSLGTGALGLFALHGLSRRKTVILEMAKSAGLMLLGLVVVPGLIVGFFATQGALHQMYYCVIEHNTVPGLGKWAKAGFHLWLFPLSLPALLGLGWLCMHSSADERIGGGRALILMTCGAYYFLLRSYWPLVTAQDFTPVWPLIMLTSVPLPFHLLSLTGWPARLFVPAAGLAILAVELGLIWKQQSPLVNQMRSFEQDTEAVLRLTNPDDYVMDGKGETIFRKRPTYWVFEGVTIKRMQLGLIPDDVRERMIATSTCVAVNHRIRPQDKAWFDANYIEGDGKVWVAGKKLGAAKPVMTFHTDFPARYSIVSDKGPVAGTLDGHLLLASQQMPAGDHRLALAGGQGKIELVWTQALDRGFNPFTR
jgi:hypothetical protein